jgi:hypothetical protein
MKKQVDASSYTTSRDTTRVALTTPAAVGLAEAILAELRFH